MSGLTIVREGGDANEPTRAAVRLYLTAGKDRVVAEGDPDAAFLLAGAGAPIPAEYLHLVAAEHAETDAAQAEDAEGDSDAAPKASRQPRNKQSKPDADKAAEG